MVNEQQCDLPAVRELLLSHIERFAAYHSQKENMTWAAATLYVIATVILVGVDSPFWSAAPSWKFWPFFALLLFTGGIAFYFILGQFRRREAAHVLVVACSNVVTRWLTSTPLEADLVPVELGPHGFGTSHDFQKFPAAVIKEIERLNGERQRGSRPRRWRDWLADKRLTVLVMAIWTLGAIVKLLSGWAPFVLG